MRDGRDYVLEEIRDRVRRIEIRQTKYYESQGFDTGKAKPIFNNGEIEISSMHTTMKEILDLIPVNRRRGNRVPVIHHGKIVLTTEF